MTAQIAVDGMRVLPTQRTVADALSRVESLAGATRAGRVARAKQTAGKAGHRSMTGLQVMTVRDSFSSRLSIGPARFLRPSRQPAVRPVLRTTGRHAAMYLAR
jgi:hypothetical protein